VEENKNMDRRGFLKGILGVGAALGAAGLAKIEVPKLLPEEPDIHVDKHLTDAYMQETAGFIADRFFPTIPVHIPGQKHNIVKAYCNKKCVTKLSCTKCNMQYVLTDKLLQSTYLTPVQLFYAALGDCPDDVSRRLEKEYADAYFGMSSTAFTSPCSTISYYQSRRQPLSRVMCCTTTSYG
jgi:hypothetical protein